MFKIDLHTHSIGSGDGGLTAADYKKMLESSRLDYIAITDHDNIDFAQQLKADLGDKIIIGEEIATAEGEIIGLYLQKAVPPGLTTADAIAQIHGQGGLVYIPHPFETVRKGLSAELLDQLADQLDIIEIHNGRALFQNKGGTALRWAAGHHKAVAAASDSHGWFGWGKTFTVVDPAPTNKNLVELLKHATHVQEKVGLRGLLYPKLNRFRKKRGGA